MHKSMVLLNNIDVDVADGVVSASVRRGDDGIIEARA